MKTPKFKNVAIAEGQEEEVLRLRGWGAKLMRICPRAPLRVQKFELISSKTKGPGEQGAAGYCPKILVLKRVKVVLCPFHRSRGKSALEIGEFLRRNFWMISGGPFLSRPLCFIAKVKNEPGDLIQVLGVHPAVPLTFGL